MNRFAGKKAQVEGISPLPVLRCIPRPVGLAATVLLALFVSTNDIFESQAIFFVLASSAVVGIRCSGTVSGEREGQTWEALLLTPLPVRELIREKLHGILNAARPYLIAYGVSATVAVLLSAAWPYLVVMATAPTEPRSFPGSDRVGRCGVDGFQSARRMAGHVFCRGGRRLLFGPLAQLVEKPAGDTHRRLCRRSGDLRMSAPLVGCGAAILVGFLSVLGIVPRGEGFVLMSMLFGIVVGWGVILWKLGSRFLVDAQKAVVGRERTPYWKTGVNCGWAVEQYLNQ